MWPTFYIPNTPRVEGTPPPRYVLTTPPYPPEVVDELKSSAVPVSGLFGLSTFESVKAQAAVVSGVLATVYKFFDARLDEIKSSSIPVSGVLKTIVTKTFSTQESVKGTAQPVSGALKNVLVEYTNWPLGADTEDLLSTGVPVSGVLA